jgi:serine/threonine protein kinase
MMMVIKSDRKRVTAFPELGRGGEAVVYKLRTDAVAKVFHLPTAMEYKGKAEWQNAAKARVAEMQTKLRDFPTGLPDEVVVPTGVLMDGKRKIFGYVMPYTVGKSLEEFCRTDNPVTGKTIYGWLVALYDIVSALHARGVVLGDVNEKNVLVGPRGKVHVIDMDAAQFGRYQCRSFSPRFTAPELLDYRVPAKPTDGVKKKTSKKVKLEPVQYFLASPHTELTDWYSFLVIAMRLITLTDPFGGTMPGMELPERMAKRITVFNPQVVYPVVARPLRSVPRPMLELFFRFFQRGERFVPDRKAFKSLMDFAPVKVKQKITQRKAVGKQKPTKRRRR